MEDLRQDVIDGIIAKIKAGKHLTKQEVRDVLYLCRDHTLLYIARETMSGKVPERDRMACYNVLQNAVERHELVNGRNSDNPLEEMSAKWRSAIEKASDAIRAEA